MTDMIQINAELIAHDITTMSDAELTSHRLFMLGIIHAEDEGGYSKPETVEAARAVLTEIDALTNERTGTTREERDEAASTDLRTHFGQPSRAERNARK